MVVGQEALAEVAAGAGSGRGGSVVAAAVVASAAVSAAAADEESEVVSCARQKLLSGASMAQSLIVIRPTVLNSERVSPCLDA